ncbi:hypothetical protein HEK616_24650 [Streptomyces nigrescens]|uniref:Integral membrane protein n=2 Tax=Streptomyces TaxID=1883 RepID=A0ABM7ZRL7_STRNI|nr:hypothetical protein [Streptomyces nigrescens]MEE4418661.1 hypothetical protein [Streptomyces sp. DSM 41528]BDM68978.1 hypothetical protein HEK616_24650 [Streptomyces nigrescens]
MPAPAAAGERRRGQRRYGQGRAGHNNAGGVLSGRGNPAGRGGSRLDLPGGEGRPLSPYDDRAFGELAESFRHPAVPYARPRTPPAGRRAPPRPGFRGTAWLLPAAAAGSLAAGILLAHALLLAGGLVLAGLSGHLSAGGRGRRR